MTHSEEQPLALGGGSPPSIVGSRTSGEVTTEQKRVTVIAVDVEIDPTLYASTNDAAWGMDDVDDKPAIGLS